MDCFHRFHVMRCDDNLDKMKCVTYPCVGSPTPARKPCTLRKPKPFCSRCGRSEPAPLPCGRVPRCFQPCNKCIAKHNACRGKKKRKLKNKKTNTDCILVPPIPKCMKRRKKKRTRFETHDIRSPCSILSLQNKRGLVNPHPGQHRHCRKYYPLHPQICCDKYLNRSDCHRPKSCSPCRKNIATCTSAAIEPKCVQIRKKMNLAIGGSCNVAPTCDSDTAVAQCNNDETLKCTTVSKGCMCEPGCCDELICNLKSAPCQRPYCEDAPCQAGVVSPCFNDPPCKVAETCYRPTCYDDPLCENQKDGPCYNRPKCFENQSCETEKVPPCYRPKCLDDPPCKATEFDPCPYPKCIRDLACKRDKVPPCHRLKCLDHPPCIVDAYRPCQRPPKKRNKRTNTKAISKCWKLKKLPKLRRVKKKICSKKIKNECCAEDVLCGKRNSKSSVCDCLRSLRTRSLTCCATGKQTQVSTIMDSCLYNPCQRPNIITKISCNSSSMRNLGLMQSCFPNRVKFLDDCGMSPCGDLPGCYLYRKEKCIKKCEQHKKRQRCCKCILTCSVAILCAPCFLVALSYWLIKYVCSSCYENNDCNEVYPCEMPSGDIYYSVPGLDKNCHGGV
nr:keratin-associated protein 16-1-like isoform X2 [Plodia interpunctella]